MLSGLAAQGAAINPFEITKRLPEVADTSSIASVTAAVRPDNPFEKYEVAKSVVAAPTDGSQGPLLVRRGTEADFLDARGRSLGIHVLLFFLTALLWIFFRPILSDTFRATVNEGIFNQLYRRRESGQFGVFFISYILFFLAGGFFAYLVGQAFDWLPSDQPWHYWSYYSALLFGVMLFKHAVLSFFGWLFELQADLGRYSFMIMLFAIIMSMLLVPFNLLVSYAPSSFTLFFTYLGLAVVSLLYLFRSFRALLMSNKQLTTNLLHFLLYLCAVELAPAWALFHFLGS